MNIYFGQARPQLSSVPKNTPIRFGSQAFAGVPQDIRNFLEGAARGEFISPDNPRDYDALDNFGQNVYHYLAEYSGDKTKFLTEDFGIRPELFDQQDFRGRVVKLVVPRLKHEKFDAQLIEP